MKRGVCSQINHFPEDADFDHDGAEYVLRKSLLLQQQSLSWQSSSAAWMECSNSNGFALLKEQFTPK